MRLVAFSLAAAVTLAAVSVPAGAQDGDALLRRAVSRFFAGAEVLRIDAVPDLYEGGYARISMYARRAKLASTGMVVDEVWTRVVGATLNVTDLRRGVFRVESFRGSAMQMRISLQTLEAYFNSGDLDDVRVWSERESIRVRGTVPFRGARIRLDGKGQFELAGPYDVNFLIDWMRLQGLPLPQFLITNLERQYNPVVTQKTWPVTYPLRAIRLTTRELIFSSQADLSKPCAFCLPPEPPSVSR